MEFQPMPKIPRLSREIIVTEKIDGTNASVYIEGPVPESMLIKDWEAIGGDPFARDELVASVKWQGNDYCLFAGSRTRWIRPGKNDNCGFAAWVRSNAEELVKLGPGHHFGEWWGKGIQRNYGLTEKRFSLFNTYRWSESRPECCHVVPVLYQGLFDQQRIELALSELNTAGSVAAPGFMNPEGVVIYHVAGNLLFKKTIDKDGEPKNASTNTGDTGASAGSN